MDSPPPPQNIDPHLRFLQKKKKERPTDQSRDFVLGTGWQKRALGLAENWHRGPVLWMWNVTSLVGKEPELGQKWSGTNYIVGFTSKHSPGPEAKTLERGWTFSLSSIKIWAGVGILKSLPEKRVTSMRLRVAERKSILPS